MMQFTFNNQPNQNRTMLMNYGKTQRKSLAQLTKSLPIEQLPQQTTTASVEPKMTWGPPIWFLFHTLAHKVKDDSFPIIREGLLKNIYSICSNLPCPVCTNHAMEYLNKINFNNIRSKDELIKMLYVFHNDVNKRKKMDLFPYSDVYDKYKTAVTKNIVQYFMAQYEKKTLNVKMPSSEFHRKNLILILKRWFNDNLHHFDP
jgi:hypothetical protein